MLILGTGELHLRNSKPKGRTISRCFFKGMLNAKYGIENILKRRLKIFRIVNLNNPFRLKIVGKEHC
jgi:hypothetical protein